MRPEEDICLETFPPISRVSIQCSSVVLSRRFRKHWRLRVPMFLDWLVGWIPSLPKVALLAWLFRNLGTFCRARCEIMSAKQ